MLSVIGQLVNQKIAPGLDAGFRSKLVKLFWVTDRHYKDHQKLLDWEWFNWGLRDCYERTYDLCLTAVLVCPRKNWLSVPERLWDEKLVFAALNSCLWQSECGWEFQDDVKFFGSHLWHLREVLRSIGAWADKMNKALHLPGGSLQDEFAIIRGKWGTEKRVIWEVHVPYPEP